MRWMVPQIRGLAPIARYDHSMIYNEVLGLLVVYGGRNDKYTIYWMYDVAYQVIHVSWGT